MSGGLTSRRPAGKWLAMLNLKFLPLLAAALGFLGAGVSSLQAQTVVDAFEYPTAEDASAVWTASGGALIGVTEAVSSDSGGTRALRVEFSFPSTAFATETLTGPVLETPVAIRPDQYLTFRVLGDPAFRSADFKHLYLYAYDVDGNFGRWGAPVPVSDRWQVANYLASTMEKPWNSPALPDLNQIVRFAFFQYGSELAIPAYAAAISLDDLAVRDTPLVPPATPVEQVVDAFEYADTAALSAAWVPSANATLDLSTAIAPAAPGAKALKVRFEFPSVAFTTELVTGPDLPAPIAIAFDQYLSFRIKGDPAFAAADFRNLYLYAYDGAGNFGRWGAPVPTGGDWQIFNFRASTIEQPWNSTALPNLGNIVRFAFVQYGSEAAIAAYSATIEVDELAVRNTPLTDPAPPQEQLVEGFEYADDETLAASWGASPRTLASLSDDVSPRSTGLKSMKLEFNFASAEWVTESVSGPLLETRVSIGAAQYVTFRVKGDPAFAASDFHNLYLYVYDAEGHFGRWGAEVPETAEWKVLNFPASAIEQPWNSAALPDLNQIVRFAFFQYGSQAALAEYSATVLLDEVMIRNTALTEFPLPSAPRVLIDDFEGYADSAALNGFYSAVTSPVATTTAATLAGAAPQGTGALQLDIAFAAGQYPWGSVRSAVVAPFSFPSNAVASFRFKGDPALAAAADAGTSVWLSFFDANGRAIHWVTSGGVVTSGEWTTVQSGLNGFGDTSTVDIGNLVQWRLLVQGWQGTAESGGLSGTFLMDDVRLAVPSLQVSGTPPAGMTGATLTGITVDEAGRTVSADIPADSTQGFLTITPAQNIQSVAVEAGRLVVRW
ncbi:MAG: hypothetical protein J0L84_10375 [Verrucomicrobia bacterium]|nr:hypothetical protein [Verrucomicrobiota bacterium]